MRERRDVRRSAAGPAGTDARRPARRRAHRRRRPGPHRPQLAAIHQHQSRRRQPCSAVHRDRHRLDPVPRRRPGARPLAGTSGRHRHHAVPQRPGGAIVARRASDSSVRRRLDNVHAAEGFDYSEESIGTNGLGTSMVEKRALLISGSQHYNDALATLACAAAPVCTPSGSVIGSISLGGPDRIGEPTDAVAHPGDRPADRGAAAQFRPAAGPGAGDVVHAVHELTAADRRDGQRIDPGQHPGTAVYRRDLARHVVGAAQQPRLGVVEHSEPAARRTRRWRWSRAGFSTGPAPTSFCTSPISNRSRGRSGRADARPPRSTADRRDGCEAPSSARRRRPRGSGRATARRNRSAENGCPANSFEHIIADAAGVTDWTAAQTLLSDGADVVLRRAENIPEVDADQLSAVVDGHRSATITGKRTNTLLITADRDRCCAPVLAILDEIGYAARTQPLASTPERIPSCSEAGPRPGRSRRAAHDVTRCAAVFCAVELAGKYDRTRRNARSLGQTGAIVGDRA